MIADRARRVMAEARDLEQTRRRFDQLEAFSTRLDAATSLLGRLQLLVTLRRELHAHGIPVAIPKNAFRDAADRVTRLRQAIGQSGHQALANAPFNAMMAPVERVRAELETAVNAAWRAY